MAAAKLSSQDKSINRRSVLKSTGALIGVAAIGVAGSAKGAPRILNDDERLDMLIEAAKLGPVSLDDLEFLSRGLDDTALKAFCSNVRNPAFQGMVARRMAARSSAPYDLTGLDLESFTIPELALLFDTLRNVIESLVGAANQPRCTDRLDSFYIDQIDAFEYQREAIVQTAKARPDSETDSPEERDRIFIEWGFACGKNSSVILQALKAA